MERNIICKNNLLKKYLNSIIYVLLKVLECELSVILVIFKLKILYFLNFWILIYVFFYRIKSVCF